MAEYKKLSSDDIGSYGISKFLNENIPFGKKPIIQKSESSEELDKLELVDFGYKNESSNQYNNKYNSLSLFINKKNKIIHLPIDQEKGI